mmetsp:Transcript_97120/g.182647  ORF Transcript_97120/g.182647 Transcript_97120/m.182647 type:complete len:485 (-) Transcript_97120:146-1600(-)
MDFVTQWTTLLVLGIALSCAGGARINLAYAPNAQAWAPNAARVASASHNFPTKVLSQVAETRPRGQALSMQAPAEVEVETPVSDAPSLNEEALEEAKKLYELLDKDSDGQVTKAELREAMQRSASIRRALQMYDTQEAHSFIDSADTDNDGMMSFDEFASFLAVSKHEVFNRYVEMVDAPRLLDEIAMGEAKILYDIIDANGDGQITKDELKEAVSVSPQIRNALNLHGFYECTKFIENADIDNDGLMSFDEFKSYVAQHCIDDFREYMALVGRKPKQFTPVGPPRQKNVAVVILRQRGDEFDMLLELKSHFSRWMPGHLAAVEGYYDPTDRDSSITAARAVAERTGLLDLWPLEGVPSWLLRSLFRLRPKIDVPPPPRNFMKFAEGENVDWWALLLEGSGTFVDETEDPIVADIAPLMKDLPDAELAPRFGHAWVPVSRLHDISLETPMMWGLRAKASEAVTTVLRVGKRQQRQQEHLQKFPE